jgi:ankyrin repeat protein
MELLKADANPNEVNKFSMTPFLIAISSGHTEISHMMLDHGADANAAVRGDGTTALMMAAQRGNVGIIDVLIQKGAIVDKVTTTGTTALMFASLSGKLEAVQALRIAGANVNMQDNKGLSALMVAAARGHGKVVGYIIQHDRAGIDEQDKMGRTAMLHAIEARHQNVIDCLVATGAIVPKSGYSSSYVALQAMQRRMTGGSELYQCS